MSAAEQISRFSHYERRREQNAAQRVADKLAELEAALALAEKDVMSDAGSDSIHLLQDTISDSGIRDWLRDCNDADLIVYPKKVAA